VNSRGCHLSLNLYKKSFLKDDYNESSYPVKKKTLNCLINSHLFNFSNFNYKTVLITYPWQSKHYIHLEYSIKLDKRNHKIKPSRNFFNLPSCSCIVKE